VGIETLMGNIIVLVIKVNGGVQMKFIAEYLLMDLVTIIILFCLVIVV